LVQWAKWEAEQNRRIKLQAQVPNGTLFKYDSNQYYNTTYVGNNNDT
jgi:hypothetical protein